VPEDGGWDLNIELAGQSGNFLSVSPGDDGVDTEGSIFEGWFGWTFGGERTHRVALGYFNASGDDDPLDGNYGFWIPLFEDPHEMNRLGNLDLFAHEFDGQMTNVQDINVSYRYTSSSKKHSALFAVHGLSLAEDSILLGPDGLQEVSTIGTEIDIEYMHHYSKTASFQIGIAHLLADEAAGAIQSLSGLEGKNGFATDLEDITRIYAGINLRWGKGKNWQ
jgi:hypothetical protein